MYDLYGFSYVWDKEKNSILQIKRNICFEDIVTAIKNGNLLHNLDHRNKEYKGQKILVVQHNNYTYNVPYRLIGKQCAYLITIYPSRKSKKLYS